MNNTGNTHTNMSEYQKFRDQLHEDAIDIILFNLWKRQIIYIDNANIFMKEDLLSDNTPETPDETPENTVPPSMCPICYDDTPDMIMCNGHASVCKTCLPNILNDKRCPICRENINDLIFERPEWWVHTNPLERPAPFTNGVIYYNKTVHIRKWNRDLREWDNPTEIFFSHETAKMYVFKAELFYTRVYMEIRKNKQWWIDLDRYGRVTFNHKNWGKLQIYTETVR